VIGGAGSNSTSHAIELTQIAEEAGCDATLSVGPYYNKPTQKGFLSHFGAIAEAASRPVILYNVPGRTASNISAETTLELAEIPNVVGIKEASGNLSQIMKILSERPSDFLVLSGDDAITLALLALGADGVISVAANQAPKMMHEMTQHALRGRWAEARELHYRLLPLMEINFVETNPVPVKTGVAMMGLVQERFRLPLVRMSSENRTKLQNIMAEIGLI
jgi:4-hydroxy-tetrahydrodipicolinate synthase